MSSLHSSNAISSPRAATASAICTGPAVWPWRSTTAWPAQPASSLSPLARQQLPAKPSTGGRAAAFTAAELGLQKRRRHPRPLAHGSLDPRRQASAPSAPASIWHSSPLSATLRHPDCGIAGGIASLWPMAAANARMKCGSAACPPRRCGPIPTAPPPLPPSELLRRYHRSTKSGEIRRARVRAREREYILSPWWLRPTSEGAANAEKEEKDNQRGEG